MFKKLSNNKYSYVLNFTLVILVPLFFTNVVLLLTKSFQYKLIEIGIFAMVGTVLAISIGNHFYQTIFTNITKQRQLEEEVRRTEKLAMVGELAAGTAHEIRNPLTSVKGFIQLLKTKLNPEDSAQEYIDIMTSEIDRINSIIGEFLLLSKASQPSMKIISIEQILDEIILLIESEAILKNVKIHKDYHGYDLPKVRVNAEQLKQVFLNLTTNAMAAMAQGGDLFIKVFFLPSERMIAVSFKDTGEGIPAGNLEKIFNPFFTTKETGTGLGLTVSNRIIQNHGGNMSVDSEIGNGTSFTVKLPVSYENQN